VSEQTPDLQQAIHTAYEALLAEYGWDWCQDMARVAVEAAWPVMAGPLQAAQAEVEQLRKVAKMARRHVEVCRHGSCADGSCACALTYALKALDALERKEAP
jgi:hypothetical protein